jgi:hypothetical protein
VVGDQFSVGRLSIREFSVFCSVCGSESPHDSLFCRICGDRFSLPGAGIGTRRAAPGGSRIALVVTGLLVLAGLGYFAYRTHGTARSRYAVNILDRLTKQPHEMPVFNQAVTINQLGYSYIELKVPVKASSVQLHGTFTASGGAGNTIEAYVFSEDDYSNWQKRHAASPYYTSGRVTMGKIDANLPAGPGSYYLVFNNKFSVLTPATVRGHAALTYYQ